MFTDEIQIRVRGGDGGAGCLSFRREKFVPKGGPDGGDGGNGGSIVLVAASGVSSLHPLRGKPEFVAKKGGAGGPGNRTGKRGADLVLEVSAGTLVRDARRGNLLADLAEEGARVVVAKGGRRGRGNKSFATAVNRRPRQVEPGRPGEERELSLVLKLIADVGLVGLPNAGKSMLLSVLSKARPKVAAYPFTTLTPCLGIVELDAERSFVLADIPGLIEGAHAGRGLGQRFLRHVERTRVLLQLCDCSPAAELAPAEAFEVVRSELASYSRELAERPYLVAATKVESEAARERADALEAALRRRVARVSAVTREGLPQMLGALARLLDAPGGASPQGPRRSRR